MELTEDEYDRAVMDAERVTLVNDIYGKLGGADWDVPWNLAEERFTEGYVAVRTASDNLDLFLMIGNARLLVGDIPVREPGDHGYPYAWMDEPALVQVRSLNIVD